MSEIEEHDTVEAGGPHAGTTTTTDPIDKAVAHLELLSETAREAVLEKMNPAIAEQIRNRIATTPDRPHGSFSRDVAERRRMLREMSERIYANKTQEQEKQAEKDVYNVSRPAPVSPVHVDTAAVQPLASDPLQSLLTIHPAAIARAMQGERAEAWAIVLDHLDINTKAALQAYLEEPARAAIEDARQRQHDLENASPDLAQTIRSAIARTVVPRAMREHQYLLSTTPMIWSNA